MRFQFLAFKSSHPIPMDFRIIRTAALLVLVSLAYQYIHSMEACSCVERALVERIGIMELLIIGIITVNLIRKVVFRDTTNVGSLGGGLMTITILAILGITGYTTYLVYLYSVDAVGCKCAAENGRYALYAQAIYYILLFITIFVSVFLR